MPYSNIEQITPIMQEIVRRQPKSMLDAGCGLGIYGMLARVQLDLYFDESFYLKLFREHRADKRWEGVRIDAIEGFQDYVGQEGWKRIFVAVTEGFKGCYIVCSKKCFSSACSR